MVLKLRCAPLRHWVFDVFVAFYLFPLLISVFLTVVSPSVLSGGHGRGYWRFDRALYLYFFFSFVGGVAGLLGWCMICRADLSRRQLGMAFVIAGAIVILISLLAYS